MSKLIYDEWRKIEWKMFNSSITIPIVYKEIINMNGSIFLIAVLYAPTEAQRLEGQKKRILVQPQFILADDVKSAINKANLLVPRDEELDPDRFEVLATNPF